MWRSRRGTSLLNLVLSTCVLLGVNVCLSEAIRCYVCGPIDKGFEQTCANFRNNVTQFVKQCPEKYFGCSTHDEADKDKRSRRQCERMRMNDCKKANDVQYCYCSSNLCNGIETQLQETDDEDILDAGSGDGTPPPLIPIEDTSGKDTIDENIANDIETNEIETKTSASTCTTSHFTTVMTSLLLLPILHNYQ